MMPAEIFSGESENMEFKEDIPSKSESYMKTVVAFANGSGGKLIFGVQDKTLEITGFEKNKVFGKMDAITNAIYDSCEPKVRPVIAIQEINGRPVIVVEIFAGMQKPYYIKSLGMMDGTFIRVSGTTRKAPPYAVQELILNGTNRSFDQLETAESITEAEVSDFCDKLYQYALALRGTDEGKSEFPKIGKNQLLSWKLIRERAGIIVPSNGYLLLDGNQDVFPESAIQCAVFKGVVRDIFITKKEFTGAIYQQIEDAYHFVLQHINLGCRIEGLARQDIYELPTKTIRELITNAVCHRSFLTPGKVQVALFDDRLEVTSPGMLDDDITIEKMKTGLSKIRNRGIAAAFSYMNIIEAWGSGIPRMFREAEAFRLKEPELIDLGSDFRVNLYRPLTETDRFGVLEPKKEYSAKNGVYDTIYTVDTIRETIDTGYSTMRDTIDTIDVRYDTIDTILALIRINPKLKQKEIQSRTGVSLSTVKRAMSILQKTGKIKRKGNNRSGEWLIRG